MSVANLPWYYLFYICDGISCVTLYVEMVFYLISCNSRYYFLLCAWLMWSSSSSLLRAVNPHILQVAECVSNLSILTLRQY